jgi:hypothetical protein
MEKVYYSTTGRVNRANNWSKRDARFLYVGKSVEERWSAEVSSQFIFQGSGKDSFVFGMKFPYLPLKLRRGILP